MDKPKDEKLREKRINFFATLTLALICSIWLSADISTFAFMSALNVSSDFKVGDFYNRVSDLATVRRQSDKVVIVDIGSGGRREIAAALDEVASAAPAAVGVDFVFPYTSDPVSDSLLVAALGRCPGPVLAHDIDMADGNGEMASFFVDSHPEWRYASTRLVAEKAVNLIRELADSFPGPGGMRLQSFATSLVALGAPEAYRHYRESGGGARMIDYPRRSFLIVKPEEIAGMPHMLRDKIVILGDTTGFGDLHRTPVMDEMPGVFIHACAVATVVEGSYPRDVPDWMTWVLGVALCAFIMWIKIFLKADIAGFLMRAAQLLLVIVIVWFGCWLFEHTGLILDIKKPVLMILLGLLVYDLWTGLPGLYGRVKAWFLSRRRPSTKISGGGSRDDEKYKPNLQ
ncbi:MAG: CHASE2 domain-containing protein [Muribaculaceae bacterium]